MELLSLNEIRSLSHRVPPQNAFVEFVQAVAAQALSWARRTQCAARPFDPNWSQLEREWEQLRRNHGDSRAAYELARYIESRIVEP